MSEISPHDGEDFKRPDSVSGSGKSLYVSKSPDGHTTSDFTESSGGSNSNSTSGSSDSNNESQNLNNGNRPQQQGNNNSNNNGGFFGHLFNR